MLKVVCWRIFTFLQLYAARLRHTNKWNLNDSSLDCRTSKLNLFHTVIIKDQDYYYYLAATTQYWTQIQCDSSIYKFRGPYSLKKT